VFFARTRTISFVNSFESVNAFVFFVEDAFDSPCLPQDCKDEIEISELIEFFNKCFFVFTAKQELTFFEGIWLFRNKRFHRCWQSVEV